MWLQDILAALEGWNSNTLISEIKAVFDGVLIKTTSGKSYIYNNSTRKIHEVGDWKQNSKGGA